MLKKLSLSVSLLAGFLLKADVEPSFAGPIDEGKCASASQSKPDSREDAIRKAFELIFENKEQHKLHRYLLAAKYKNTIHVVGSLMQLAIEVPILSLYFQRDRKVPGDWWLSFLELYSIIAPDGSAFFGDSAIVQALLISKNYMFLEWIPDAAEYSGLASQRIRNTLYGLFWFGLIAKAINQYFVRKDLEKWEAFQKKNNLYLSDSKLELYKDCYYNKGKIEETAIKESIKAFFAKL